MKFGIDVSKWQGNFDFDKAKSEGVQFAILRGACARTKDSKFERFYKDCKFFDVPVGVYQYSMAKTVAEAKQEAAFLYNNCLKGKKFEYPIYIDIEDKVQMALPKKVLTDIAVAWCEYLEAKGLYVGIYAGKYTFRDNLDDSRLKKYTHWIPMWGKSCTYEDKNVLGMWQFGGDTNVLRSNVVAGVVTDQNYAYIDFETIIRARGLNGYKNEPAKEKPAETPVNAFKVGTQIKLKNNARYYNNQKIPAWVFESVLYVRSTEFKDGSYNVSTLKSGAITGRVHKKYFTKA